MAKKYDRKIRDGVASRVHRRSTGRPLEFNAEIEAEKTDAWDEDDTQTSREVAKALGFLLSTLHRWAVPPRGLWATWRQARPRRRIIRITAHAARNCVILG